MLFIYLCGLPSCLYLNHQSVYVCVCVWVCMYVWYNNNKNLTLPTQVMVVWRLQAASLVLMSPGRQIRVIKYPLIYRLQLAIRIHLPPNWKCEHILAGEEKKSSNFLSSVERQKNRQRFSIKRTDLPQFYYHNCKSQILNRRKTLVGFKIRCLMWKTRRVWTPETQSESLNRDASSFTVN